MPYLHQISCVYLFSSSTPKTLIFHLLSHFKRLSFPRQGYVGMREGRMRASLCSQISTVKCVHFIQSKFKTLSFSLQFCPFMTHRENASVRISSQILVQIKNTVFFRNPQKPAGHNTKCYDLLSKNPSFKNYWLSKNPGQPSKRLNLHCFMYKLTLTWFLGIPGGLFRTYTHSPVYLKLSLGYLY